MRNILVFIILTLISSTSLKLEETNYDFVIELTEPTENSIFNITSFIYKYNKRN